MHLRTGNSSALFIKVSGPLLDRIDIHIEVTPLSFNELSDTRKGETSELIRTRVIQTRDLQVKRYEKLKDIHCNAQMTSKMVRELCAIDESGTALLKTAM